MRQRGDDAEAGRPARMLTHVEKLSVILTHANLLVNRMVGYSTFTADFSCAGVQVQRPESGW